MSNTPIVDSKTAWGGDNVSPFGAGYGKLMMWFFLMSDALSFTGFLAAYGFYRHNYSAIWPTAENVFTHFPFMHGDHPLIYVALMTFILIMSSVTMVLAVEAGHRMDKKNVVKWMLWTIIGGFAFLSCQAWEWSHFIHGSEFGKVELSDGSQAIVKGHFGELKNFTVIEAGKHHKKGEVITDDLMHSFQHAVELGHIENGIITFAPTGPLFFGSVQKMSEVLNSIKEKQSIRIDLSKVVFIDLSGAFALDDSISRYKNKGIVVEIISPNPNINKVLEKLKLYNKWQKDIEAKISI